MYIETISIFLPLDSAKATLFLRPLAGDFLATASSAGSEATFLLGAFFSETLDTLEASEAWEIQIYV